jgi:hypothetical protein
MKESQLKVTISLYKWAPAFLIRLNEPLIRAGLKPIVPQFCIKVSAP